jgi:hypothetical protein
MAVRDDCEIEALSVESGLIVSAVVILARSSGGVVADVCVHKRSLRHIRGEDIFKPLWDNTFWKGGAGRQTRFMPSGCHFFPVCAPFWLK